MNNNAIEEVIDYVTIYNSLYNVINLASERLQLKLTLNIYEGIELQNLPALMAALKNSYPSPKELFKKFPLRHLHFIDPQSKATMKSLTKHLEENKLAVVQKENNWVIVSCATNELLTNSTMKLMALFQKFIEATKKKGLMMSIEDKLHNQITANKELSSKVSELSKSITKIIQSNCLPKEKVNKLLTVLEDTSEKKVLVEAVLQMINEWIPDFEIPLTHEALCKELNTNNSIIVGFNEILSNLRLIPFDARKQQEDLDIILRTINVSNLFVNNSIEIPTSFAKNICCLVNTIRIGYGDNLHETFKSKIPRYKEFVAELKRCYTIDLSNGVEIKRTPGVTSSMPEMIELIDRVAVRRENLTFETFLGYLGDLPEARYKVYKNLEKHNIAWSDQYFKDFYSEFAALLDLSK